MLSVAAEKNGSYAGAKARAALVVISDSIAICLTSIKARL